VLQRRLRDFEQEVQQERNDLIRRNHELQAALDASIDRDTESLFLIGGFETERREFHTKVQELELERDSLQRINETLRSESETSRIFAINRDTESRRRISALETEKRELRRINETLEKERDALRSENYNLDQLNGDLRKQLEVLTRRLRKFEQTVQHERNNLKAREDEFQAATNKLRYI
jgi:chromosome segregation ATPase